MTATEEIAPELSTKPKLVFHPMLGRDVWYWRTDGASGLRAEAAKVVGVNRDGSFSIMVFADCHLRTNHRSTPLVSEPKLGCITLPIREESGKRR